METPPEALPCYKAGDSLQLQMLHSKASFLPTSGEISVQIKSVITQTMAPVMHINLDSSNAILKVYDRRMGSQFRKFYNDNIPYDKQAKAAYHQFLQSGAMGPFLKELDDEENSTDPDTDRRTACDVRDESDGVAKFEAALWRKANKEFKNEVEAYERLKEVQGVLVPRLYAVVRLSLASEGPAGESPYLDIYGIILQAISGPTLGDLPETPSAPSTEQELTSIVQHAVDATHQLVVKWGILLQDSAPRNVMLDQFLNYQPFLIDFAQCFFKDTAFKKEAAQAKAEGDEGWDLDFEFHELARALDNAGAVGRPLQRLVRKKFGFELKIVYPDIDELLSTKSLDVPA